MTQRESKTWQVNPELNPGVDLYLQIQDVCICVCVTEI